MKNKEYYFDLLEHRIINFNSYWEAPLGKTELRSNPKESVELLKLYFNIIKTLEKQFINNKYNMDDYDSYPDNLKSTIQNIINIINDGRDLCTPIKYKDKVYNHHLEKNGHLAFENRPWDEVNWCYEFLESLEEILNSEKETISFSTLYNNKWYCYEGYEEGSLAIKFKKINKNKRGKYTFDGDIITFETVNGKCEGNGIIISTNCENTFFNIIPYCDIDNFKDVENDLLEFLSKPEQIMDDKEIKDYCLEHMNALFEQDLKII